LKKYQLSHIPEISLAFFTFFLNFFWEVVQTYFYRLEDFPFPTMLYSWLHCTWGDVMITIGSFWLVSLVSRSRRWFLRLNRWNFTSFIMAGIGYTVCSEWVNVQVFKTWEYDEMMPVVPLIGVGLTPFLQWIVIPSMTILLLRHYFLLIQQVVTRE